MNFKLRTANDESRTRHSSFVIRDSLLPRGLYGLLACLLIFSAPPCARAADSTTALEYKVKAGYLFNFAKFIEWPAQSFAATNSPFVIAVLDNGEAAPVLQPLLGTKNVNGHPVQIRPVTMSSLPGDAHILFVTRAAARTPEELRAALSGAAPLLVGETEEFAERGGMIGFVREGESIRLNLNLEAASRAGLKVSAKLSSVARLVKNRHASNSP